jgi:hypothetical protein
LTFGLKTGNHHNLLCNSISVYTAYSNGGLNGRHRRLYVDGVFMVALVKTTLALNVTIGIKTNGKICRDG